MHIGDVVIDSVEIFSNCKLENQLLSVGKTVTSVSGALNTVTNFFWRNFSTQQSDKDLYSKISTAATNVDAINGGAGFGEFMRLLLMTDIPNPQGDIEYYEYINTLA